MAAKPPEAGTEAPFAGLNDDRAATLKAVRALVEGAIPDGYRETVAGKMFVWVVPLEIYPKTYNRRPLQVIALVAQKNGFSLHLPALYLNPERREAFAAQFAAAGKKLDMGKGCVRFRALDDLASEAVREAIAAFPLKDFLALYEASRAR